MEELPGGLRRVTMPLPSRPGHVHCYLLPVDDGFMLVDTGLGLPDAAELWAAELEQLPGPVSTIFMTHFHPDHLGATADVRELTGARVVQGRLDAEQSAMTWESEEWSHRTSRNGSGRTAFPTRSRRSCSCRASSTGRSSGRSSTPSSSTTATDLHGWEIVAAPGHADGQLTLLKDGVLIAADHLLARITPTVGLWPASRPDPLGDYLGSLQRTIDLAPDDRLRRPRRHRHRPGRPGQRADRPSRRASARHRGRDRHRAAHGYEVSFPLFGDDLRPAARRFAVAETLSHLERLVRDGGAERHELQPNGDVASVSYTAAQ